jgi:hypothetical protein
MANALTTCKPGYHRQKGGLRAALFVLSFFAKTKEKNNNRGVMSGTRKKRPNRISARHFTLQPRLHRKLLPC